MSRCATSSGTRRASSRTGTVLRRGALVAVVGGLLLTAACSPPDVPAAATTSAGSSRAGECAPPSEPVSLDFWSWGAGNLEAVAAWNAENPDVQVRYSDTAVGHAGGYQKLANAISSDDAPDVAFLEFDAMPRFASDGALRDVAPYVPAVDQEDFLPTFRQQVALGTDGAMLSVPIAGGPMGLLYRQDLFAAHGLEVPRTWAEVEATAKQVTSIDPSATLVNFDGLGNGNWFAGLASQAGARWFTSSGTRWSVDVNDAASKQVMALWERMLAEGTASDHATFSPEWSTALANGKIWAWPTAVWGVGMIKTTAPATAGRWAVAPLPRWTPAQAVSASWGGGGLSVLAASEHPCEAAEFALWMATSHEAMTILNTAIGIYPTTSTLLADDLFAAPDPFFGGQRVFDTFRESSEQLPAVTWGPVMTDTYAAVTDALIDAMASGTSLTRALDAAQGTTVTALEKSGYSVTR